MDNPWKEALIDAAVVNWTFSSENADDPKEMIYDLMACAEHEALDPAISQNARRLIQRGIARGIAMAKKSKTFPISVDYDQEIDDLLEVFAVLPRAGYRLALEEMQSRATAALEELDAHPPEQDGDDKDLDNE